MSQPATLRVLLALAWPMVVARSSQAVVGFTDAIMSASLGESALAAVTTGSMNTFTLIIFPMGVVFIAQSFAAQLVGKDQGAVAVRYAWYALGLAGLAGLFAVASVPLIHPVLGLMGYAPEVHELMARYLAIRTGSVAAVVGAEALGNWYGGLGNTRLHMAAGVAGMVSNVFLNWVLIYGNLGAPAMGVAGAAWASVIASWITFGVLAANFLGGRHIPAPSVRPTGLRVHEALRMLRFGVPHGLNWFLEFAAFALFINVVVGHLGTTVLAAMMVVININSVSFMPAFGITSAGAILTGQAIGEGYRERVGGILRLTLTVTLVWQGAVGAMYLLAPSALMRWFVDDPAGAEAMVEIGAVLLALSAAWQLFDAVGMTVGETLRSAGDTAWTLWARVAIAWALFTPAAFFTVRVLDAGYAGAMFCVIGYMGALALVLSLRFRNGAWRRIDLTGLEPELVA